MQTIGTDAYIIHSKCEIIIRIHMTVNSSLATDIQNNIHCYYYWNLFQKNPMIVFSQFLWNLFETRFLFMKTMSYL